MDRDAPLARPRDVRLYNYSLSRRLMEEWRNTRRIQRTSEASKQVVHPRPRVRVHDRGNSDDPPRNTRGHLRALHGEWKRDSSCPVRNRTSRIGNNRVKVNHQMKRGEAVANENPRGLMSQATETTPGRHARKLKRKRSQCATRLYTPKDQPSSQGTDA